MVEPNELLLFFYYLMQLRTCYTHEVSSKRRKKFNKTTRTIWKRDGSSQNLNLTEITLCFLSLTEVLFKSWLNACFIITTRTTLDNKYEIGRKTKITDLFCVKRFPSKRTNNLYTFKHIIGLASISRFNESEMDKITDHLLKNISFAFINHFLFVNKR